MLPVSLIAAKRDGHALSRQEIAFFVQGITSGEIPDYQVSAMAMAIYLQGMTTEETAALTAEMLASGACLKWPDDGIPRVDKHSTGGIGDKTSLIIAPLLAECGLQVPMISGRGLGPTGGTLDKLESIPGFRTNLSRTEIQSVVRTVGCVITGASAELAPADRRLYGIRDVTATVPSIPLITASIMSKKLAESLSSLVLDVKFGSGAFMKTQSQATQLARSLVQVGHQMGLPTVALLTDMNQPLGRMCGNALEVREVLDVLAGQGPADVRHLTIELCSELLLLAGTDRTAEAARLRCERILDRGAARERFSRMVAAQGGNTEFCFDLAPTTELCAADAGFVRSIQTEDLGLAIVELGGGRRKLTDHIDHSVGLELLVRIGDRVERNQPLVRIYSRTPERISAAVQRSIEIAGSATPLPLIADRIR